ncbi:MAG: RDD family protein [Prosthecobacter sp.]|uniref:RDD family protein n=1 Tax=Prosthecobacter sp. TaxID=1965333 RepID=UPI003902E2A8
MKYHLARGEEQLGTFNDLDVSAGMRDGRFLPTDLCWTEGMPEWQALGFHMKEVAATTGVAEAPAITALREEVRQDQVQQMELASLGQRLAARLIDWTLLLVPAFVILMALMDPVFEAEIMSLRNDSAAVMQALQRQIVKAVEAGNETVLAMYAVIFGLLLANIVLLTVRGQSIGKLLTGIQVVRTPDGAKAGFIKAVLLRWFLFAIISSIQFIGLPLMIGGILLIFRRDRRCLHDLVADTQVVKRNG